MQGVSSFASAVGSPAIRSTNAVAADAIVVARWNTGESFVLRGTRGSRTLVELNFDTDSSKWSPGGDGAVLLCNALMYSTCKPSVAATVAGLIGGH
jgi:hypothetical protein